MCTFVTNEYRIPFVADDDFRRIFVGDDDDDDDDGDNTVGEGDSPIFDLRKSVM